MWVQGSLPQQDAVTGDWTADLLVFRQALYRCSILPSKCTILSKKFTIQLFLDWLVAKKELLTWKFFSVKLEKIFFQDCGRPFFHPKQKTELSITPEVNRVEINMKSGL